MKTLQVSCFLILLSLGNFLFYVDAEECFGCPEPADVNDPEIQKYARIAVAEIQKQRKYNHYLRLVRVLEATTQIVAGTLTNLKLQIEHQEPKGKVLEVCSVEVIDLAGVKNSYSVTVKSCTGI
ncbi:hypothetical protein C0J52_23981 [Blattella germanica]|nr:hypothetical protein C0J52_23981 [Blattella germanica]